MTDDTFTLPPDGMLSEQVVLADHRMALGLLHIEGAGIRVVVWNGEHLRHMAPARAGRWATELEEGPFGAALRPVAEALVALSDRTDEINATVAANRAAIAAGLGDMAMAGQA